MKRLKENPLGILCVMLIALSAFLFGCATSKQTPTIITVVDSTRVETKYEKIFIRDTVMVALPSQSAVITTPDSTSHLETDFAVSDARVNPDGSLTHTLQNKEQEIPVPVESVKEVQESVIYQNREIAVPEPYPVEVERELTAWQKFRLKAFWVLLSVILIAVGWKYHKPIITLIRRFI